MGSAAVALLACGATFAAGQDDGRAGASAKPRAQVLTSSQRNALRLGYVRVRLRSASTGRLRVGARVRRAGGGPSFRITKLRRVDLTRPGAKTLRLKLTRTGRRILGSCRALVIDAKGRGGGEPFTAAPRGVRRDPRRCTTRVGAGPATPPGDISAPPGGSPPLGALNTENADRCDFLDPSLCLYPFPNDHFTVADATTTTGRRLNISRESTPTSTKSQQNIDPADQNRADGFSPGNMIVTRVPGLDSHQAFSQTGAVPITDMERSFDPDQPVVVINARTKERQLIWAEVDSNPLAHDPPVREDVTLIIRPGKNFEEGERYIVALRRLRAANGSLLKPREEFRAYRDGIVTSNPDIEARRAKFEGIFGTLGDAGIERKDLYLAWDFTVASQQSLSGRALAMRNDAFEQLGDEDLADLDVEGDAPTFQQNVDVPDSVVDVLGDVDVDPIPNPLDFSTIDGRRDYPPCSAGASAACEEGESDRTARRVTGQLVVPCYLDLPGCPPGSGFVGGAPSQTAGNTMLANVICTIPRVAADGVVTPGQSRPSLYGHGLLGDAGEVGGGNVQAMGQEHNFVFCATDWAGMSTLDIGNVGLLLQDLSTFNTLVDRIQQGYVNFMYLGRWLIHPEGASQNTGFQVGGQSVIDDDELFYDGNSQGGILSGGLTALSPDFRAAVHGVPGMNYSTLLRRSVDFDMYANGDIEGQQFPIGLYQAYPNELERPLVLSLMQLLWDRGESNGFAQHLTNDPLPDSPEHRVLLHPAFGDHQVANVAAEVEARTIRACTNRPSHYAGRSPDVKPLFAIPTLGDAACEDSGIVYWDGGPLGRIVNGEEHGTPAPPTGNVPPRQGKDPHSYPRNDVNAREQKSDFLQSGGGIIDVCTPLPCFSDGFTGP